jgi:hypothetical protein
MSIRAKLVIDLSDGDDYEQHINNIKAQLSKITGIDTVISIQDIDNPISLSPVNIRKVSEAND